MGDKSDELERSSAEQVVVAAEYARAPTATVSSLKSQDSTEHLICKTPLETKHAKPRAKSVRSAATAVSPAAGAGGRRTVVLLGLAQVAAGALLGGAGAAAILKGAALARVGAGLWAGCVAVVAGVVGVLAGINDCYGLNSGKGSSGLLSGFLALSLLCLACGHSAAVLAGTGLHRDYARQRPHADTFQDEMAAWAPVLSNIAVLIAAAAHCLLSIATIYHLSKRVCPCFRRKQPYDHNQFEPGRAPAPAFVVRVEDGKPLPPPPAPRDHRDPRDPRAARDLVRDLEGKLLPEEKRKEQEQQYDSATSRSRLVSSWLGRHGAAPPAPAAVAGAGAGAGGRRGVRKQRPPPVMLVPAHPHSTLGRMVGPPLGLLPPRYATLPLPPYAPPGPVFYPVHDARVRRRRSPRAARAERRRRSGAGAGGRERDSQLTRSLERIHRKRRAERERERLSDAELKKSYTGLDRAYAEQFIAVCSEARLGPPAAPGARAPACASASASASASLSSSASSDLHDDPRGQAF